MNCKIKRLLLACCAAAALSLPVLAFAAKPIVIGFTVSETGKLNADSKPQLIGFEMWRDHVNDSGGIEVDGEKHKVEFKHYDDQSKAGRVQELYTRLILQDNADFLFSPYSSGLTSTAAVVSEQFGKVMLTTGAAEGKTYKKGNRYLFQMYTPANKYLVSALEALKKQNAGARVALVYSNDGFSKGAAEGAAKAAKDMDMNIVLKQSYAPDATDFGSVINKIVSSKADAIIGGGHYADGSTLARQIHDKKATPDFISLLVAPGNPKFASLGDAAVGVTGPTQWAPSVKFTPDFGPTAKEFTKEYKDKTGELPGYHAAGGYATGLVLEHAIKEAGSLDTDAVAKALNKMDVTTFYGGIKFASGKEDHGLQVGHDMILMQWQKDDDGKLHNVVIWPKDAAEEPLAYPIDSQ